jgi:hypothetical protein
VGGCLGGRHGVLRLAVSARSHLSWGAQRHPRGTRNRLDDADEDARRETPRLMPDR